MTRRDLDLAARQAGFDLCGVAVAGPAPHEAALRGWLEAGFHAEMAWMSRTADLRADPRLVLPGARSVIMLAVNYATEEPPGPPSSAACGRIARYARSRDYHELLRPRLRQLEADLQAAGGRTRSFVDSGPVLERDWAAAAGVSWHGKSTVGIHPRLGTWFFLAAVLTDLTFPPDPPLPDRCGSCTRCLAACPTQAIVAPYRLDARRCLSYLTIENKGPIPLEFRRALGDRIFGCDDCLEACPWNRFASASRDAAFAAGSWSRPTPLRDWLALDERSFRERFRGSPVLRAKRRGFLRNVCTALGNCGDENDLPALQRAAADPEDLVREHARWAIEEIRARQADHRALNPR